MCGIAGVYALTDRPPDPAWGPLLTGALAHRGPDGEGVFADQRVVLAHRRLAIIDLGPGGRQPMDSANGRHVIVQNGEIYNHRDLRDGLEKSGAQLRSSSDTEVLIESLARDGIPALSAMRGMFAFGCYDRETGALTLARDRLGKKPLLWVRTDAYLAFASEAQALLRLPFVRARLDARALRHYLELLYVPSPWTLIEGVRKLPAGHWLRVGGTAGGAAPTNGGATPAVDGPHAWWRPPACDPHRRVDRSWLETLDREFLEATRLRTVSDVPIGVFLSGGIDSNAVLECLKRTGHRPIRTFTIGFEGMADERDLARMGATAHADEHQELIVRADVTHDIPEILSHFGEPLGDSAVINNALIAREAARHVKVILNGDGGDELFGGYARYPFCRRVDLAGRFPGGRALLRRLLGAREHVDAVLDAMGRGRPRDAARALGSVTLAARSAAFLADGLPGPHPMPAALPDDGTLTGAMFAWDTGVYLPDDLLVKVDVASMAFGLENRSPFLDHRLFEHVAPLRASRRAAAFETKPLLRRLERDRIPREVLTAPKRGFDLPLDAWLRGPLREWAGSLVGDPQGCAGVLRADAVRGAWDAFQSRGTDGLAPYRIWGLAALEFWARHFGVQAGA
jgi:asparagine synthase (glutamine-hydrolysing)